MYKRQAWEGLKSSRAKQEAEQIALEQKREADKEALKLRNQKTTTNSSSNTNTKKPPSSTSQPAPIKPPKPAPPKVETPREQLSRLKDKLQRGLRTEMPKASFTRAGRARMYIAEKMTWHNARRFCENHGGHLTVLPETADLSWLCSKLKGNPTIWLGAGSSGKGQWSWIDGSSWKHEIRSTSKSAYVAVNDTTILEPQPASNKNSFFIEWIMDGTKPASFKEQLRRCANSLDSDTPMFPPGTISYNNRHYLLVARTRNWPSAKQLAKIAKGDLATPSDPDENVWILEFISKAITKEQACWIGGIRDKDKSWRWTTFEPWEFAHWREGAPDVPTSERAGCAVHKDQLWDDHIANKSRSHFLIEWSEDAKGDTSSNTTTASTAADDPVSPIRTKCATLIKGLQSKYAKDFTSNIKGYEQELNIYRRSLTKSLLETYGPIVTNMMTNYPNDRIPTTITRTNMPSKAAEILDERIDKQNRIQVQYLTEIETLRQKYHSNLKKIQSDLDAKGLKSHSRQITQELNKTDGAESFTKYILDSN